MIPPFGIEARSDFIDGTLSNIAGDWLLIVRKKSSVKSEILGHYFKGILLLEYFANAFGELFAEVIGVVSSYNVTHFRDLYLVMIQSSESFLSVGRVRSTVFPSSFSFLTAENLGLLDPRLSLGAVSFLLQAVFFLGFEFHSLEPFDLIVDFR